MDLLIENCMIVADGGRAKGDRYGCDILVRDGTIRQIAPHLKTETGISRLDASGCVAIPGLINTHHHMFQSLTRATAHDQELFGWLASLWGRWLTHDAEWQHAATSLACAELLLSGCTTTVDHHYLPPRGGDDLAAQAAAATSLGIRLIQAVGSMDISDRDGGLAPSALCESADAYLARLAELVKTHHDPAAGSRLQIAVAPCHPLAVTEHLAHTASAFAREHRLRLHTHLAEARTEEQATLAATGLRPLDLLDAWGLLGADVWLAHCVHLTTRDIQRLAATGTAVATCPSSNLRLGSGIAPIRALLDAGVAVGLGVDGSASNDAGNLLYETRQLLLASRAHGLAHGLTVRESLHIATAGGAAALGRPDLGLLKPGYRADIAIYDLDAVGSIGTQADPVAGLLLSPPSRARHVVVDGDIVVRDGNLAHGSIDAIRREARAVVEREARRSA